MSWEPYLIICSLVVVLISSFPLVAHEGLHPRVEKIEGPLNYDGCFIEPKLLGVLLVTEDDKFTLMLDSENQIWFDDSFQLKVSEKQRLLPYLVELFETVDEQQGKAILARLIKASIN